MSQVEVSSKTPVRKAHWINQSCMITIAPEHVKRLGIDDMTFFIQEPVEGGILLKQRKIAP